MGELQRYKLEDICEFVNGFAFKSTDYVPPSQESIEVLRMGYIERGGGFKEDSSPVFVPKCYPKNLGKYRLRKGDIVIAMTDMKNNVAILGNTARIADEDRFVLNQRVGCIRIKRSDIIDSRFLYFYTNWILHVEYLRSRANSGVQVNLSTSAIKEAELIIPSLATQKKTSELLGALDDKIELNRKTNETLEALARTTFYDWFVDFGPTRAKAESRESYLAPELWDLFPNALDSKDKPEGWDQLPLDEIAEFLNGLALQKFPVLDGEDSLPVIKIAELRSGISVNSNRASRNLPGQYIVRDGDFLFSWSGSLLAKFWTGGEGALNQHLFKVTSDRFPVWFFSQWIYHHLSDFQAIAASKATTMGHIQRGHLKAALTICPPDDVLSKLSQTVAPLVDATIKNELESRTLAQTRDLLLPKLMSGEIRLREADRLFAHIL